MEKQGIEPFLVVPEWVSIYLICRTKLCVIPSTFTQEASSTVSVEPNLSLTS